MMPTHDSLDETKLRFIDVDGVRTRYYEAGKGEPLVLLHGGHFGFVGVCALDTWSLNLAPLAEHFHVYALDKLGQGYTDIPARDEDYTYDAVVLHAARWLDSVGLTEAHLVGHSRGGLLAMSLAFDGYGKSLVVVDSATLGPDPSDPKLDSNRFYAEIERRVPSGPPSPEGLRLEPAANSFSSEHITEAYIERCLQVARLPAQIEATQKMRERLNDEVFMPNLRQRRAETLERLDEEGVPVRTLLVWGRMDPSASFSEVGLPLWGRLCQRSRDVELHVFNNAGHYSYREYAAEFNRLVTAFCLAP